MPTRIVCLVAVTLTAGAAVAEVTTTASDHFAVALTATSTAPPASVYRALVNDVGRWWSPDHTFSGDAANLSIDGRAGGCFCEALPDGGSVRHMEVVLAEPGSTLRLSGGLGPLQGAAVAGTLTVAITPAEEGSSVRLDYLVSGYSQPPLDQWAGAVDRVLAEQLARLVRFADGAGAEPR